MARLLILMLFITHSAFADVALKFNNLPISEMADTFFRGILKKDFIISPDLITDTRTITVNIASIPEKKLEATIIDVLKSHQIEVNKKSGIYYLNKVTSETVQTQKPLIVESQELPTTKQPDINNLRTYKIQHQPYENLLPVFTALNIQPIYSPGADVIYYESAQDKNDLLQNFLSLTDQPSKQVLVQAYLYEFTKTNSNQSALTVAANLLNSKLSVDIKALTNGNIFKLALNDITAVLSVLDTDNRFSVVSNPSLRLTNGKTSKFTVGTETPILQAIQQTGTGITTQSIVYRPSGVILEVKPTIFTDNIQLELLQQVSNFVRTSNGVNDTPTLIKRELNTTLNINDGETILLGGLTDTKQTNQKTGVSWLPSLFGSSSKEDTKSDIFLVLQVQRI